MACGAQGMADDDTQHLAGEESHAPSAAVPGFSRVPGLPLPVAAPAAVEAKNNSHKDQTFDSDLHNVFALRIG